MTDIRKVENLHVALWLTKDVSWCASWHWLGMAMVLPTIVVAAKICWDTRHSISEFVHNSAVCLWICANITWMIGEFYFRDTTRGYAKVFFYSGLAVLSAYYAHALIQRFMERATTEVIP